MAATTSRSTEVAVRIVDCDVHPFGDAREISEYVPEPWRSRYYREYVQEVELNASLYTPPTHTTRVDATPPGGGVPGADPAFVERQLLQEAGVDFANLIVLQPKIKQVNPEFESALFAGHNAWLDATWLGKHNWHGRYRGSLRVSPYDPDGAVREIERWAGHPYFSQVYIAPEATAPFGQPQFEPIFAVAERHGLPVAMHVIRHTGMRNLTPAGFASYHVEVMTEWPLYFMSHLTSLVFEGGLDRHPGLRIVCVEGGFSWMAPLLWRLDRHWEALGSQVPGVRRRPSDALREQVRVTTQPLDEPEPQRALLQLLEWMGADRMLMFSSDYPHYDYDDPGWVLPRLPKAERERILFENACELYGLPQRRPFDRLDAERGTIGAGAGAAFTRTARLGERPVYHAEHAD